MSIFKFLTRRRQLRPEIPYLKIQTIPKVIKKQHKVSFFKKTDPPEAAAPGIPYLEGPQTHTCHEQEKDMSFSKS